jgi:hypothetical protein
MRNEIQSCGQQEAVPEKCTASDGLKMFRPVAKTLPPDIKGR